MAEKKKSIFDNIRVPLGDPEDSNLTPEVLRDKMKQEIEEAMMNPELMKQIEEDRQHLRE